MDSALIYEDLPRTWAAKSPYRPGDRRRRPAGRDRRSAARAPRARPQQRRREETLGHFYAMVGRFRTMPEATIAKIEGAPLAGV